MHMPGKQGAADLKMLAERRKALATIIFARCSQQVALVEKSGALLPGRFLQALGECHQDAAKQAAMQRTLAYLDRVCTEYRTQGRPSVATKGFGALHDWDGEGGEVAGKPDKRHTPWARTCRWVTRSTEQIIALHHLPE